MYSQSVSAIAGKGVCIFCSIKQYVFTPHMLCWAVCSKQWGWYQWDQFKNGNTRLHARNLNWVWQTLPLTNIEFEKTSNNIKNGWEILNMITLMRVSVDKNSVWAGRLSHGNTTEVQHFYGEHSTQGDSPASFLTWHQMFPRGICIVFNALQ